MYAFTPYIPSPEMDLILVEWWGQLQQLGELEQTFGRASRSLTTFLKFIAGPDRLCSFAIDAQGIAGCFLIDPVMSGAFVTLWIAPRCRASRAMREALVAAYQAAFQHFPVLLGVTRQPRLLQVHQRWGYRILGSVPHLFDGEQAWVVTLTAADFAAARMRTTRWARTPARDTVPARSAD